MTHRPIIDAGPGLNFLSINKERLLFATMGALSAPETVRDEVLRKASEDRRFAAAAAVWRKLPDRLMQVLSDDFTPELARAVHRLTGLPMNDRKLQPKDLGETMVIAHAVVAAEAGQSVTVLIDDGQGARLAAAEVRRLLRLRADGRRVGTIALISTLTVLERAAGGVYLPDKSAMRETYKRLRALDDGLVPIEATNLLSPQLWS
jgi:hypothetical protein